MNLALIRPFILGAFEIIHASVRKEETAKIKLTILDVTVLNSVVRDRRILALRVV